MFVVCRVLLWFVVVCGLILFTVGCSLLAGGFVFVGGCCLFFVVVHCCCLLFWFAVVCCCLVFVDVRGARCLLMVLFGIDVCC